jgi:hypothetical protein
MAQDILAPHRAKLLDVAVQDTRKWCGAPDVMVEQRQPDRFWLELFGGDPQVEIGTQHAHLFLASFHLAHGPKWDEAGVAAFMTALREQAVFDPQVDAPKLAARLGGCSAPRSSPLSAASKLAFFAKPTVQIFIWDPTVMKSARLRDRQRGTHPQVDGAKSLRDRIFGVASYPELYASAERALGDELKRPDFRSAADQLIAYFDGQDGIIADRSRTPTHFIERRLLDKLMFWEGWTLKNKRPPEQA